jgi:tetratricopeptide (TPR) repeat protein
MFTSFSLPILGLRRRPVDVPMSATFLMSRSWLTLACMALLVAGCGGAESRKAKHLAKGDAFLAAGNLEKARVEYRNALQIVPTDSVARYDNGVVAERLGSPREAAQFFQGAIDSNPDNVLARASLGRVYLFGGAPDKALETIKPSIEKHPDDPKLLTVRAAANMQLKDTADALKDAERAVQLAPTDEDAISVLAGIYKSQNDGPKAQALLQDAIKRIPGTINLRLVLAQLDSSLGKRDEVQALLLELVKLQPNDKAHRLRLAQFYARNNQNDETEQVLRDGIKALPHERDLKTALVDFLAGRRSQEAAEKEVNALIAADPTDYELKFVQAHFYEQAKQFPQAATVYEQVIAAAKLQPAGIAARNRLAALRVETNEIPAAEKLIAEVLAESPRDNDALILRGNLALAQKDPRAAITDLRAVLRDQPNAVGVMRTLARAHLANDEPALAEETMRRAVDASPNDPAARLDLAQLLTQLGKPDQAKPVIEALVKQQPNDLQALDAQFRIAVATKDMVLAKASADALVAAEPKAGIGYYYLGKLAELDKRPQDSISLYSKALELQPESSEPLEALARVLVESKRAPEALKRLDEVNEHYPKLPVAANLKGEVLLSTQHPEDAAQAFQTAIDREPTWWTPYRNLAATQLVEHNNDAAIGTLRLGIGKVLSPTELVTQLAVLFERQGKPDDAAGVYEAALRRDPKSDVVNNNLAMLLVTYKKDPASLERAKELSARFASSSNPNYLDTYGWVLYKRGDAAAAVAALQAAAAKTPDSPVSLYHLGMAEALAGQSDAARETLTRSLRSGRDFSGMEEARATLDKLGKDRPSGAVPAKS